MFSNKGILAVGAAATIIAILAITILPSLGGNSIQICDNNSKTSSIKYATGFALIQPGNPFTQALQQNTDVSIQPVGIYEFVLKPGSVGYVKMVYDFCPNAFGFQPSRTANYSELSKLFQSVNSTNQIMYRLNDKPDNNNGTDLMSLNDNQELITEVLNATGVGIRIYPSDLVILNSHSVSVTYAVSAEPSAYKATYVITNFYGICPAELLTVGDAPNEESREYAKGPFYGCSG